MTNQLSRKFCNPMITLEVPDEIDCQGCITGEVTCGGVYPIENAQVSFASSLPDSVSFDPNPAITDENGKYTAMVTIDPTTVQTLITIQASTPIANKQFTTVSCTTEAEKVYITNDESRSVTVVNGQDNVPITTLSVQSTPYRVAVTPNGQFAYVANLNSGSVSVIRVADNTIVGDPIPTGGGSQNLVISPDSAFVYVYNIDASTVSVIRVSDNTVVQSINIGRGSRGNMFKNIAMTPDGQFVYVANTQDSTISVIQTSNNTVIKTIPVTNFPLSIASTPDSKFVYVVSTPQRITVIQTSDQTIFDTISVSAPGIQNLAVTPDGQFVYVIGNSQFVSVVRTADNSITDIVELTNANFGIDIVISPSSDFVYVTSNAVVIGFGALNVIEIASNKVIKQIGLGNSPQQMAINTSGSRVYVSNSIPDAVEVIQTSNNTLLATVPTGGNGGQGIAVTP